MAWIESIPPLLLQSLFADLGVSTKVSRNSVELGAVMVSNCAFNLAWPSCAVMEWRPSSVWGW